MCGSGVRLCAASQTFCLHTDWKVNIGEKHVRALFSLHQRGACDLGRPWLNYCSGREINQWVSGCRSIILMDTNIRDMRLPKADYKQLWSLLHEYQWLKKVSMHSDLLTVIKVLIETDQEWSEPKAIIREYVNPSDEVKNLLDLNAVRWESM